MPNSKQIVYLSQAQYAELIANGTITVDGVTVTYDENDIYVTPQAEPVTDVRVNGTSVTENGVANVPAASTSNLGVVKINEYGGIGIDNNTNALKTIIATDADIKAGTNFLKPLVTTKQHTAVFYGLAKAASDTTQASSSNAVGVYTDAAKAAIQHMLGTDTIIAPNETDPFTSAHAIGELFTMNGKLYRAKTAIAVADAVDIGVNCEEVAASNVFVKWTDTASASKAGIVGPTPIWSGVKLGSDGSLYLTDPNDTLIKQGNDTSRTALINKQHLATFYGLAKAAGDTTQAATSSNDLIYTSSAKNAIHTMLGTADLIEVGFVETVSGSAVSITGQANYRYNCTESSVTTLSITPPSAGSIDVYFTSGSSATVLTVPNTVKWPAWFDATALEPNTLYEILITDGVYGSVMTWAT